jgi:periplasmic protein TonB
MGERLFDTVFVAGRRRATSRFSLPVSVAIHAAVIGGVLAVSLSATTPLAPPVPPPRPLIAIARADPAPPAPAPAPPRASRTAPRRAVDSVTPPPPTRTVQPPIAEPDRLPDDLGDPPSIGPGLRTGDSDANATNLTGPSGPPGDGPPGGTGDPGPVRAGYEVREPRKLRHVEPVYPELAKIAGISGVVEIECIIGTEGRVTDLRVLRGNPLFTAAAVQAVQQWVYSPTSLNGRRVPVILTVRITFKIR